MDEKFLKLAHDGLNLSTYAASINWHGGGNTQEWLVGLEKRILRVQRTAEELGINQPNLMTIELPDRVELEY